MNKIFCKNILLEYRFVHMYDWVSKSLSFTIISIICKECVNEFYMNHQSLITNRLDDFLGCRKKNQIDILVVTCSRKINPVKLESLQYDDLFTLYLFDLIDFEEFREDISCLPLLSEGPQQMTKLTKLTPLDIGLSFTRRPLQWLQFCILVLHLKHFAR